MKYLVLLTAVLAVSACTAKVDPSPKAKVYGDGYAVEIGEDYDRDFCPPGQAKKGNC